MPDKLDNLLRRVDEAVGAVSVPRNLAERAVRTARRRRSIRIGACAAVALLAAGLTVFLKAPAAPSPRAIALAKAELANLESQARFHDRLAERLAQRECEQPGRRRIAAPKLDDAAFALVYQADRLAQREQRQAAVELYRQVVSAFGATPSAEVARQRLKDMQI